MTTGPAPITGKDWQNHVEPRIMAEDLRALEQGIQQALDGSGGGGSGAVGVTADDTPAKPAEGQSASYLVSSAVTWPAGLVWSTDPDGGVAPTITGSALVSLFTVGGVTRAIMGATFPAFVPIVPPGTLTYQGTYLSTAETATTTYAAAPLGAPSANRQVIVMVSWWAGNNRGLTSVSIAGVEASIDAPGTVSAASGTETWRASVPSGTSGDIVATFSNTASVAITVWTVDRPVVYIDQVYQDVPVSGTGATLTLPGSVAGGFALAGHRSRSSAFGTTWTGVTERWDRDEGQPGSAGDGSTTGPGHTITAVFSPAATQPTRVLAAAYRWGS